jgi:Skp family chaperone for outer membrane proteins
MNLRNYRQPLMIGGFGFALLVVAVVAYQMGRANYQVSDVAAPSAQAAAVPETAAPAAAALASSTPVPGALTAGPPDPKIIVIDRQTILRLSAAGKAMTASAMNLSRQADTEFRTQAETLQKEVAALQQQLAILAPEARTAKQNEFQAKQDDFEKRVQERQTQIQNGFAVAGQRLDQALGPILQQIMRERGANMMLDRSAVILSSLDIDVTPTAIERLDKALPTLAVSLARTAPAAVAGAAPPVAATAPAPTVPR